MDARQYERWTAPLRRRPQLVKTVAAVNETITRIGYIAYPVLLVWLALAQSPLLLRAILGPGIGFALVTLVRRAINEPRPYEALDIRPLMYKGTKGKSLPSRHAYSICAIATAWAAWCAPVGIALLACSVAMGVVRVLGGIHYPHDVLAGMACGLVAGGVLFL